MLKREEERKEGEENKTQENKVHSLYAVAWSWPDCNF